ncbi:hypothetical protein GUITHDRAFT_104681 [Guillardia theta CCMP2712]|uniref:SET domain-containing protein n=1 Tax=Guillardia theta (strain CCMP2712) TaxID=905079 RepID=L1JMP0_GUITC|nr:hypothetical protein GUITHDRAFT_104681 [Guillardia theta CCMP2712]EKX49717.1 hypothetical protein GUITHDRAFT_104681 [Guillardia theta CCMP2712]|eukprot:XP_005836697.1 hypothetical protein GUITHDRAFT_104681 [Guillardia theta CCMP2712]
MQATEMSRTSYLPLLVASQPRLAIFPEVLVGKDGHFTSKKSIQPGDVLISVPLDLAITVPAKSIKGELSSDIRLAVLEESGDENEQKSKLWQEYANAVLPTALHSAALKLHFDELVRWVERDCAKENNLDEERLKWALGIVRSRSFLLDSNEDFARPARSLVPAADLFNHLPESPVTWAKLESEFKDSLEILENPWQVVQGDDGDSYIDICSTREWRAGEEVLLPYGLETNIELLSAHGLVLRDNEAEYLVLYKDLVELLGDVCELELQESLDTVKLKLEKLQTADACEAPLAIRPGSVEASGHLLSSLQLAYATVDELPDFEDSFSPAIGHFTMCSSSLSPERTKELRAKAIRKVISLCEEELKRMETSLADDDKEMEKLKPVRAQTSEEQSQEGDERAQGEEEEK